MAEGNPGPLSLWRSSDDCETFSYYKELPTADREMMVIDNNPGSNYGRFYLAYVGAGITITYSDDGIKWADQVRLSNIGGTVSAPWPAVDPTSGDVYVAWTYWHTDSTGLMDIQIARSTNGGENWGFVIPPLTSAQSPHNFIPTALCGRTALNGYIFHMTAPQIVVDRDSNLHVVYSYDPDGLGVGDVVKVYYRRSTDQGTQWGPEVQLNDDATTTDQWNPTVSVGSTGTVVATWYDRRNDPDNNLEYNYYMATSVDNGVTWGPNIRVSDISSDVPTLLPNFDPNIGKDCYHGEYDQQVQHGAFAYIIWSDDRNIKNNHPDPDVWFEKALVTPDLYHPIYLPLVTSNIHR